MVIKKYSKEEVESMDDKTDYDRVSNMTENEVRDNAKSDSDAPLQTESELEGFRPARKRGRSNDNN